LSNLKTSCTVVKEGELKWIGFKVIFMEYTSFMNNMLFRAFPHKKTFTIFYYSSFFSNTLNGIGLRDEYFLKVYDILLVLSVCAAGFTIFYYLGVEKI
jgi:hypothetical protein